jgi:hypothetical protein
MMSLLADELEGFLSGQSGGTPTEALAQLSRLMETAQAAGVVTEQQLSAFVEAAGRMIQAQRTGPGSDAFLNLMRELRDAGSGTEDLTQAVKDLEQSVADLTAELVAAKKPAAVTSPASPIIPARVTSTLDAISAAVTADSKMPRPKVSPEELSILRKAYEAALANAKSGVDPHNPQGKDFLASRDKLAAEIAAMEAKNQTVPESMRRELWDRSADPIVTTQEAYIRNSGAAYQKWLNDMLGQTTTMEKQWTALDMLTRAVNIMSDVLARVNSGWSPAGGSVNPLSGNLTPGQESTAPFVIRELRVPVTINGREVGNALVQDLALQGVRM